MKRFITALMLALAVLMPLNPITLPSAVATVASTDTRISYAGTGAIVDFAVPFTFYANTDLVVIVKDADGVEALQILDSHYSVAADHSEITMATAPALTETLVIIRVLPLTQLTDYPAHGPFPAASHELALDRLVLIGQQLQEQLNRTPHIKKSSGTSDIEISGVAAGEYLRWNLAGDGIDSIDQVSDLGTFLQSGAGMVPRTAASKMGEILSVKDAGATGDGATDDSAAFHTIIVAAGGAPVFVPPGTYLLSTISSYTFDTDIVLFGSHPACTVLDGNDDQSFYMVKTGYDSHEACFYNLAFENFDIALACQATANTITHLKVDNCYFNSCDYAGIKAYCKIGSAEIINSRFDTIGPSSEAHGIVLGADVYASQDSMTKYIIKGNKFKDITATASPNPARAILCYGREVIITDNLIENIEVGTDEDDAEGIYVKARFSNISDNVLINAGSHQGWITIKGSSRGVTSSPQGFANVVANNNLYSTNDSDNDSGIFISNDSVLVVGNHLEGFNNVGIYTGGTELDDIAIIGNKITRTRGAKGISLANYGRNLQVHDNQITGLLGTKAGLTDSYGIYLYQYYGDLSNVSIQDNQIDENDESSITGIIWGIYCHVFNTRTVENLVIQNNQINIVHSTEAERCLQIVCDAGGTIDGLKMKNNQLSADGTPLTLTFTGTVSGFVYEPMELGITADMAGHETFTVNDGRVFIKDPDGGARNFNPSGEFPDAYQVTLVNTADAAEAITFDSAGLNQAVAQNERGIFVYTGAAWLTVYVG